jgi:hypothetical protein
LIGPAGAPGIRPLPALRGRLARGLDLERTVALWQMVCRYHRAADPGAPQGPGTALKCF